MVSMMIILGVPEFLIGWIDGVYDSLEAGEASKLSRWVQEAAEVSCCASQQPNMAAPVKDANYFSELCCEIKRGMAYNSLPRPILHPSQQRNRILIISNMCWYLEDSCQIQIPGMIQTLLLW
ncbi:hypothetical protein L2E82_16993 [Cichorium intybus]|uniref:Uncharacterized protein n=1 Tax=Cichorium intybus TaxID=13427 RepID=A0ACB9F6J2_CICIN|nr:hypothetical protein L2E82_16993 [Cichorium intybus]